MKWYNNVYFGKNALMRRHKIIKRALLRKMQIGIYFITLPANEENLLDIYPANILTQKNYRKRNIMIVGVGSGYTETMEVMQNIIMDCYEKTGQFHVSKMIESENLE